ncbi:MAG: hypothetical protein KGZ45_08460 [Clostridium sp.]|nr:hypothetical protein [Clostridium sp.]
MRTLQVVVIIGVLLLPLRVAQGWPVFAERVGQPCATCHQPGFTALAPFGEAFRQENYRWPGEDEPTDSPPRRLMVFNLSMLLLNGIFAALFIGAALAAVFLQRKYKKIARGRWHHRLAIIGSWFAFIHIVLAVLQRFFGIVLI